MSEDETRREATVRSLLAKLGRQPKDGRHKVDRAALLRLPARILDDLDRRITLPGMDP